MRLGHADNLRSVVGEVVEAQPVMVPACRRYRRQRVGVDGWAGSRQRDHRGRERADAAAQPGRQHVVQLGQGTRSEEHTSELQSHLNLVCRLLLEKKKEKIYIGYERTSVRKLAHS